MKENRAITCGIFYCRDSAEIKVCGSLQTSSRVDSDVLRSRQQNIPLSVMGKFKNKDGLHKLKGLTTQSDKKQYISGDQNPLKKNGAYSEKPYE